MIKSSLLHYELQQAGLPVSGVSFGNDGLFISYERDLTVEEQVIADDVVAAHDPEKLAPWEQEVEDAETLKPQIISAAQNLAGVSITDMTTGQLKLLLLVLAYESGAINVTDLTIRPLGEWVGKP